MAYLKQDQTIFIANNGNPIYANVDKVAFRKYWGKKKDKNTGKMVRCRKSMPYALCKVQLSSDQGIPVGAEFSIAGYMLRNVVMKGEKILTFDTKYVAEFADAHGNEWVRKMITEEYWKDEKSASTEDNEES
tara:strand:+ start:94 stop:489 length:396 start_codon:yes stop_codon:yes gene_type:complete